MTPRGSQSARGGTFPRSSASGPTTISPWPPTRPTTSMPCPGSGKALREEESTTCSLIPPAERPCASSRPGGPRKTLGSADAPDTGQEPPAATTLGRILNPRPCPERAVPGRPCSRLARLGNRSILPEPLPPSPRSGPRVGGLPGKLHPHADPREVPPGQIRQRPCLVLLAPPQVLPVLPRSRARGVAGPGMAQNVTSLVVALVGGFLEHQVLGKVCRIVAEV